MADAAQSPVFAPPLPSSSTARTGHTHQARAKRVAAEPVQRFLDDIRVMKSARFNAHERLLAKHVTSVVAFSLAAVGEIAISVFAMTYDHVLSNEVQLFLAFAGVVTGLLLLVSGLVVGLANYQARALNLQRCAMDLANMRRQLEFDLPVSTKMLQDYRRRYHEIVSRCPDNHSDIDFERALARRDDHEAWRAAQRHQFIDIYGLYLFASIAYVTMWGTFWWLFSN